ADEARALIDRTLPVGPEADDDRLERRLRLLAGMGPIQPTTAEIVELGSTLIGHLAAKGNADQLDAIMALTMEGGARQGEVERRRALQRLRSLDVTDVIARCIASRSDLPLAFDLSRLLDVPDASEDDRRVAGLIAAAATRDWKTRAEM